MVSGRQPATLGDHRNQSAQDAAVMSEEHRNPSKNAVHGPPEHRPVWWLEDPFGSIVTGIAAPVVAVALLAAMIAVLASAH